MKHTADIYDIDGRLVRVLAAEGLVSIETAFDGSFCLTPAGAHDLVMALLKARSRRIDSLIAGRPNERAS